MADGKKGRKVGRSKRNGHNQVYKLEHRHEKGHYKRVLAHLKRYGARKGEVLDKTAAEALKSYATQIGWLTKADGDIRNLTQAG